ncbi:LPXTG cell wall anchor domain-containing protein [Psychromicrobium sp. YIM B11713]|uniref:LPXTG cell wall anchor domain-containing protein n=1 Tax=Psychromicrobium sp. YIM B11713 TaxID=3145233 RepID=UPI00374FB762
MGKVLRWSAALGALSLGFAGVFPSVAHAASAGNDVAGLSSFDYDLGQTAFADPGLSDGGMSELAGRVYLPARPAHGKVPVVFLLHGSWIGCLNSTTWKSYQDALHTAGLPGALDNNATKFLTDGTPLPPEVKAARKDYYSSVSGWPCPSGSTPTKSNLGYEYLAQSLAQKGIATVSIAADGLNQLQGDNRRTRANLLNKQMGLWQEFTTQGTGVLANAFKSAGANILDLQRIDMTRVGTLGHSRGGGGVINQASQAYLSEVPAGVQLKAVAALAPSFIGRNFPANEDTQDLPGPQIPFTMFGGNCDSVAQGSNALIDSLAKEAKLPQYRNVILSGGVHNFFNTRWAPSSELPEATDDALHPDPNPQGTCQALFAGSGQVKELTEQQQRGIAAEYLTKYFQRYLLDDKSLEAALDASNAPMTVTKAITVPVKPEPSPPVDPGSGHPANSGSNPAANGGSAAGAAGSAAGAGSSAALQTAGAGKAASGGAGLGDQDQPAIEQAAKSTGPLANTGSSTEPLLWAGGGAVILGVLALLVLSKRRQPKNKH